ncbi:fimbrial protein [Klebsiella oxytoca]|uniref:fimbrial protein n=1 Tax=Klebsiella oxytoca TaxID=571 RepID=UPI00157ACC06|nr:fimbrial protein [Klebsiella oxytoca]
MERTILPGNAAWKHGLIGGMLVVFLPTVTQAASETIDGLHGIVRVSGTLTESACRLEMSSADQSVSLGNIDTARFTRIGARGTPVVVKLHLQDCLRNAANNRDLEGNLVWSAHQPAVSLTFTGAQDTWNPQLFLARGVSGMGIRLTDVSHRNVMPGLPGQPQLMTPGNNVLTYYIVPERTSAPLQAGAYLAQVNFRLNYE